MGPVHFLVIIPIFSFGKKNQITPINQTLPSVIVLDNASYHNIKTEETVVSNFNQRKAVLQDYLSKHNIPFQPLETKKQPSSRLPACKTINLLPFPEGIFGASEPSTGNHM
jgi:hypothetical protein